MRRPSSPWMTPPALPASRSCPTKRKPPPWASLVRAVGWFSEQGIICQRILSQNGSVYRSREWRKACNALDLSPIRTRPSTPRTNGMAERFIRTLVEEWAYGMTFQTSDDRNQWLSRYLGIHNDRIGATSPSVVSRPDSRCNHSRSLNDLVRTHP
jgi:hypothetical protein